MRWLHPDHDDHLELSIQDVFLVPNRFEGTSRTEVDLTPADFLGGSNPVVAANMNAVTGKRMAETIARCGGFGVLPQDMAPATARRIIRHIKDAHVRIDTALAVAMDATVRQVEGLIRKRDHGMVVVLSPEGGVAGVITLADLRDRDQYARARDVMSRTLVTLDDATSARDAYLAMDAARVKAAPVVCADGKLLGVITKAAAVRGTLLPPALDRRGRLMVGAAVGISADAADRAADLVDAGVDVLVLDTAHGHQRRMLEAVAAVRHRVDDAVPLVAGNVCTAAGALDLIDAGADVIKVNVGPGAMCTTRMQTGVGRPTFSAVKACADAARTRGKHVWADGGVRHPRDVSLYLAAGASRVMVGTMLAGTYESPGDLKEDAEGCLYKVNYGMASARAVRDRTLELDPFQQAQKAFFREGISHARIYLREGQESAGAVVTDLITGLKSAFTYVGASTVDAFQEAAVVGVQTASGFHEGTPHGRVRK
jgi:IMP dehydrogenase